MVQITQIPALSGCGIKSIQSGVYAGAGGMVTIK